MGNQKACVLMLVFQAISGWIVLSSYDTTVIYLTQNKCDRYSDVHNIGHFYSEIYT